jgi:hypothetical protein
MSQRAKIDSQSPKKWPKGYTVFSQMKGRVVERIELYAAVDSYCISVCFQDHTDFTLKIDLIIESRMGFAALHLNRTTGNQLVLERWPAADQEP